jgi:flagellar basal body rod protein FlgG
VTPPRSRSARSAPTPRDVNLSSLSGMQAATQLLEATAIATAGFGAAASPPTAAAAVDLAEQVTNLITATVAYNANARVVRAQDETTQAAIDVLA